MKQKIEWEIRIIMQYKMMWQFFENIIKSNLHILNSQVIVENVEEYAPFYLEYHCY